MSTAAKPVRNEILEALRSFKSAFCSVGVFSAILNLLMLVPSIYMLQVYDRVLASRNETTLLMLTLITLGLFALLALLEFVRGQVIIRVGAQVDMQMNQRVYTAAFEQNLRRSAVNAGQSLGDLTTIRQFVTGPALFAFFDAPFFPIYLAVIFYFNTKLGLLALVGAVLLMLLAWVNERVSHKPLKEANSMAVVSSQQATNNLRNAEVIEAMGMLPALRNRWYGVHDKFLRLQAEASDKAATVTAGTKFVRLSLQSLVLGLGALLVVEGEITAGMMIAASILMGRTLAPVEQVIGAWKQVAGVRSAYGRLKELLDANPARVAGMSLPPPKGNIALEGVLAAPPGVTAPVLKGVSFAAEAGDVVGIIGPSASGKSTLARLLVGVWPAAGGKVRLDGADVYQWNKDELGPYLGYLPQDIELFSGSISENIARFGEVDAEKVVQAANLAGVHELILRFPKGYDTQLGDGGAGLSGGQKQRIGLARALYGLPRLIVLDEPNSNLDDAGERALSAALAQLKALGRTVVVITHRTNLLSVTDKLLLLVEGQVQAFGPSREVLATLARSAGAAPAALAGVQPQPNKPI
ncbi:type I secretion system permease/ATPase [Xenophilus sp. Marseille-Q4582]|uniref:type I secretion system permease/ATPase n=1 Tax=Xenophilus sp. Marseille-Q4582 TaxID=2866600 RepID=UPI001CE45F2A|nr:type I secretion system permease/ATPase [Xenophilus sp. Marseille-Q4582]